VLVVKRPKKIHQSQPNRKHKPQAADLVNAAHVTVEPPVQLVLLVSMDAMVSMDSQVNPEIVEQLLKVVLLNTIMAKNNAHARHHPEMVAHKDHEDKTDLQAMLVLQALTVNQAALDQPDQPAQLAIMEMQAVQEPQENLAIPFQATQAQLAQPDPTAIQVLLAQQVNPAGLAKTAVPAVQALPEMLVPQAVLAMLAVPVVQAMLVTQVLQAVANTAHQLVWLQVIKRRQRAQFGGNTKFSTKSSINSKIRSCDFSPKCISASFVFAMSFLISSFAFSFETLRKTYVL